jgi:hypothetical protein
MDEASVPVILHEGCARLCGCLCNGLRAEGCGD